MRVSGARRGMLALLMVLPLLAGGCIVIRTTEQRVKFNRDGSGEAVLRLIDIRSDAEEDSLVQRDFNIMMTSFEGEMARDFEEKGRKIVRRQFSISGDTLTAEIFYTFREYGAIEGLRVTKNEMYVVVPPERRVLRTNGKVGSWGSNASRVSWDRDAQRISFAIQEKSIGSTRSLAALYRSYGK